MNLRPYQVPAVNAGLGYFKAPMNRRGLIVAPTAAGKSFIIAAIAKEANCKILVLQPSVELLKQNVDKFRLAGGDPAIFSASAGQKRIGKVTYATIGSVMPHASLFRGYKLIVDEAHLYPSRDDSMFAGLRGKAGIDTILGLTATPFRLNQMAHPMSGERCGTLTMLNRTRPKTYNVYLHVIQIQEIIRQGYWSKLVYNSYGYNRNVLKVTSQRNDYTARSMSKAFQLADTERQIIQRVKELREMGRKKILIFVPTVAECYQIHHQIDNSKVVHGQNPGFKLTPSQRAHNILSFTSGVTDVMINVNVLSVGFDFHKIDAIVMARPTMSLAWYYQAVGRGTRVDPEGEKVDCLVEDFAGNLDLFGRIEDIVIEQDPLVGWGAFGSGGSVLTGIPLENSGKQKAGHRKLA